MEFVINTMFKRLDELEVARHRADIRNKADEEENLEKEIEEVMGAIQLLLDGYKTE